MSAVIPRYKIHIQFTNAQVIAWKGKWKCIASNIVSSFPFDFQSYLNFSFIII